MKLIPVKQSFTFTVFFACCLGGSAAPMQKHLTGTVMTSQSRTLQKAIVKLQDTRPRQVRSYITGPNGKYHFRRLLGDIDYQVWASYGDHDSSHHELSRFDSNPNPVVDLSVSIP